MQKKNEILPFDKQLIRWEQEILKSGSIKDFAPLIQTIQDLEQTKQHSDLSKALTLAAKSRFHRRGFDSLVLSWLQKAVDADPSNHTAKDMLLGNQWKSKGELFDRLVFPRIRETDNRALKKKNAEQYIEITQNFLDYADEELEDLKSVSIDSSSSSMHKIIKLREILEKAIEETTSLLKATRLYEESVTGVFHTAVHYEEMKKRLSSIEDLRELWRAEFTETKEEIDIDEDDPLEELNKMVGLPSVKQRVNDFYRFLQFQQKRKEMGLNTKDSQSLNIVLTGNPGTGKTSLARLLAKIYHDLGVLPGKEIIEADRSSLVGAYVGQTEENVRKVVEQALGGVLFIDEAYSLKREGQSGNDYGQTAIDTLVSLMTGKEFGGKFAVILAGYPDEMRQFLNSNPGLRSRFPQSNIIHLPDYSIDELLEIGEQVAMDNDFAMTEEAKLGLKDRIERERVDETFGNARTVRTIVLDAIFKKGSKFGEKEDFTSYTLLEKSDFEFIETEKEGSPLEKLNNLIGLENVKLEVKTLISFVRMQQIRKENGMPSVPVQVHSVFTGNPGTGKTSVAKIYAELLKECGLLKRGHLVVTSRADFVAGYVGQTAIKTKKKIREALGGVLFIDEAYSLLGKGNGDFGREVIDTLVDEMTRHNENLVVILAGYPDEIEGLLESNPGLRSRFKKFFHFPDYSSEELFQIIKNYADHFKYSFKNEAITYLKSKLKDSEIKGNGRFATNLVDEAIQSQAYRLIGLENSIDLNVEANYLESSDFEAAFKKIKGE